MSGTKMQAMILERPGAALELASVERPEPSSDQVLIQVEACAVCRTDLHVLDGELSNPKLPLILGHEIVGIIRQAGASVKGLHEGDRVGVPWLGRTCHNCKECLSGRENLCQRASFTGYTIDGGYAEFSVANAEYCFPIPEQYSAAEAAPLLCAGLIGWRSYKMAGALAATMSSRPALTAGDTIDRSISRLGIYGFGAAGHIIAQVAARRGKQVYAFTRSGDHGAQELARRLGCIWAGSSEEAPPDALDAALIFAPVGALLPLALKRLDKGGVVVCGGIHMSDIPPFPYADLWQERKIASVANLTRLDATEFLEVAGECEIKTEIHEYPLFEANQALADLKSGRIKGAAVLIP